jgi:hypothetical protein
MQISTSTYFLTQKKTRRAFLTARSIQASPKFLVCILILSILFSQLLGLYSSTTKRLLPKTGQEVQSLITDNQLIRLVMADFCSTHEQTNKAMAQTTDNADQKNTPLESDHQHCSACLIGLDSTTIHKSNGVWRDYAAALALSRTSEISRHNLHRYFPKPFAQGPPQPV